MSLKAAQPGLALMLLAACAGPQAPAAAPGPVPSDTVTVWVTDARDTLALSTDTLARMLHAAALHWQLADTGDAATLVSMGRLPLLTHGPFHPSLPADVVHAELLPWGRLYALVSDSIVPVPGLADSGSAAAVRDDLARFAVTTDAQPSITPPPLAIPCDSTIARAATARPRIVYLQSDVVARQVAERLAALARLTSAPLAQREFAWALSDGREAGVVVAIPLLNTGRAPVLFCDARLTALLETRATLITRAGP